MHGIREQLGELGCASHFDPVPEGRKVGRFGFCSRQLQSDRVQKRLTWKQVYNDEMLEKYREVQILRSH
jgi:hypothetical protein